MVERTRMLCHVITSKFCFASIVVISLALAGCQKSASDSSKPAHATPSKTTHPVSESSLNVVELTEEAVQRIGLETTAIVEREMPRQRTYGAELVLPTGASVIVSAPVSGTMQTSEGHSLPEPGASVKQGTELLQLVPLLSPERDVLTPAERIRFAEAKNTVAQSQIDAAAQVQQAEVQVEAAQIALDRAERLLSDKSGTVRVVDEAKAQLKLAETTLEAAKSRKSVVDAIKLDADAGTLQPITVKAPMSGIIRNVQARSGQILTAGSGMFEIMDDSILWVRVPVYVGDVAQLNLTAAASLTSPGEKYANESVSVTPVTVPPTAQPLASTVDVYYQLKNKGSKYWPGQRFRAAIEMTDIAARSAIPWSAVYVDIYGNQWLYEKTGERQFVRRRVEVSHVADGWAALDRGPANGTTVVTAGVAELAGTEFGFSK